MNITSQIALDEAESSKTRLYVRFPHVGLLLLKNGGDVSDEAEVVISTPDGEISYRISIIKREDIGLDEIFEKQLYFMIPFFILNYKDIIDQIDADEEKQETCII